MNNCRRLDFSPIIVGRADARIIHQVEFLEVLVRPKVDADLSQLIVVKCSNLESKVVLEKVGGDCFNAVVVGF